MGKGISIFLGMDQTLEQNLEYMQKANNMGFKFIFTSLHIPEANNNQIIDDFKKIARKAQDLKMNIVADISPRTFKYLNIRVNDLQALKDLGLYGIRVDFGFTPKEIADFTRNKANVKIEINASTVSEEFLIELEKFNPNYKMLQSCHNYYPRLNTGISQEKLIKKNNLLKKYGIPVSAFLPSLEGRRGPIYEGLPTLENHRFLDPYIAGKHLLALGVDNIIFGDSVPSDKEIQSVGNIDEDCIELNIRFFNCSEIEKEIILKSMHKARPDLPEDVIRGERPTLKKEILPLNNTKRKVGYITIDNKQYLRYQGEIQICKKELSQDSRVNVVGKIVEDERFLIDYITDNTKFKFVIR